MTVKTPVHRKLIAALIPIWFFFSRFRMAGLGQTASRAFRSNESAEPKIAAATGASLGGSGAPFAGIRRVVGRLMVYMHDP
jgi:hypothetical protein